MQLDFLRPLYEQPGPYASVCMDASTDTTDSRIMRELRWRALRESLAEQGTDQATIKALDGAVGALPTRPGRWGAALFASSKGDVHTEEIPHPPVREFAKWSMLPQVSEVVRAHVNDVRWIRVVMDRTGADITTSADTARSVNGTEDWPLHKSGKGGWSAPRFDRSVEVTWERNAAEVADQVATMFDRFRPDLVILAGDPEAVQLSVKKMPERVADKLVLAHGSRGPGADNHSLIDATDVASVELVEREREQAIDRYRMDSKRGLAAQGLADVTLALRSRAVDTLFLTSPDRTDELWITSNGDDMQLSPERGELGEGAVSENVSAALIASAAVSDADLVVDVLAREHWRDGVGAALRFPLTATA